MTRKHGGSQLQVVDCKLFVPRGHCFHRNNKHPKGSHAVLSSVGVTETSADNRFEPLEFFVMFVDVVRYPLKRSTYFSFTSFGRKAST